MNKNLIGKLFVLKDPDKFWVLSKRIDKPNCLQDGCYHIITSKDHQYFPMKLYSVNLHGGVTMCCFTHPDVDGCLVNSFCENTELTSLRLFTPSRLDLINY